jgi:Tol biopolymer transport system component
MQDDLHTPRYIQTISKVGYRLIGEVRPAEEKSPVVSKATLPAEAATIARSAGPVSAAPQQAQSNAGASAKRPHLWPLLAVFLLIAATGIGLYLWQMNRSPSLSSFRVISLTSYPGEQDQGAFSPGGDRIAFVWTDAEDGNRNIFIKQIGSEALLRLTRGVESDYCPVWSPDGAWIAYLVATDKDLGVYEISSLGGSPRKLYTPHGIIHWEQGALSWSPDGKTLIFPDSYSSTSTSSSIYAESLETLQVRVLTTPPKGWDGDLDPVFSHDGRKIAFIRASDNAVRDIYVMPAGGGEPKQITRDGRIVDSLTWAPDSSSILFSSDRGGEFALWKVSARGGEPERLPVGVTDAFQPAVSGATHRLLYTQSSATWSILGFELHPGSAASRPRTLVSSTQQDSAPSFAPDGSVFAFQSWRSGSQELWSASRDGSALRQLTDEGRGLTGSPSFSPDSQQIAFDSRIGGHSHIFVVPAAGGPSRQLTTGNSNNIVPRWSADGQSIYFASNRSGNWQSWKLSLHGGQPQQITTNGGFVAMESPDRRWIYYTKSDLSGLWRMPYGGGAETRILPQPRGGYWGYWCVARRGIYLLDTDPPAARIIFYDFATEKTSSVATLERPSPPYSGISVDRDEDELLITDERNAGSHITLVENYR